MNYFSHKKHRSDVYRKAILSYIDVKRQSGYKEFHFWVCAPKKGADYIFYRHPEDQKIPDQKRLRDWYLQLLNQGLNSKIIASYSDTLSYHTTMNPKAMLSIFKGDFIADVLENILQKNPRSDLETVDQYTERILKEVYIVLKRNRKDFFVVCLNTPETVTEEAATELVLHPIITERVNLVSFFYERKLEFSTLRRAQYTTHALLRKISSYSQSSGTLNIVEIVMSLPHVHFCENAKCRSFLCKPLKTLYLHVSTCSEEVYEMCNKYIDLVCIHSKSCQDTDCKLKLCKEIKVRFTVRRNFFAIKNNKE